MEKIVVDLENCYGIKALKHEFDTRPGRTFLLYAPNGSMKTSFARVFADISEGNKPSDVIFPQRETKYSIKDDKGSGITDNKIFVVEPYQENFNSTRTATLLVNQELRKQYENAVKSIDEKKDHVLAKLGEAAQIKKGIHHEVASAFGVEDKDFLPLLESIALTLNERPNPGLENIAYGEIFNSKVIAFLSTAEIRNNLLEYIERYNELIDKSTYLRRGLFDHNNAAVISKSLKDNGFFAAQHTVILTGQNSIKTEITSQRDLERVIAEEKHQILNDPLLADRFETIDKAISRNVELRQFRHYLENNPELIPELLDLDALKQKLWISYSFVAASEYATFLSTYQTAKNDIARVIEKAKKEETEWRTVVSIFHERFSVPFSLEIANQDDVILKDETPSLIFRYKDGNDEREIGRDELINVLSTGEKRALYLLNIIFDIQALMKEDGDVILVLDDIADSFDYKNKYAIIEYIKSLHDSSKFIIFVLTHNFDFFRTVQSRLNIHRANCLMALKSNERVFIRRAEYLNPFKYWRTVLNRNRGICTKLSCDYKKCPEMVCNQRVLIATIPMVRNLIEYMYGVDSQDYLLLTSLLHIKANTDKITIKELGEIFNKVIGTNIPEDSEKVLTYIYHQADISANDDESINFEHKIILSIAIRLLAERFMVTRINSPDVTNRITGNQTRNLYRIYKDRFPSENTINALLEKVVIMTPETIHLNSFMYEPILDLSDYHLRSLYTNLQSLLGNHHMEAVES